MPSLDAIVERLHGKREGSEYRCECPVHQGRSLVVGAKNGTLLFHCHAGCSQEDVIRALQEMGLWETHEAAEGRAVVTQRSQLGEATSSASSSVSHNPAPPEAEYPYYVGSGTLVAVKKRFAAEDGKRFEWWRPGATKAGLGGKVSQMPLYNAHLIPAEPESLVWFVEGEKAADVCVDKGLLAVSGAGGAGQTDFGAALLVLESRNVVLWPDNDPPGRSLMQRIHRQLTGVAERVRTVSPEVPEHGDAADWFAAGHSPEELSTMLAGIRDTPWVEQGENGFQVSIPDSGGLIRLEFADIMQRLHELQADVSVWQEIVGETADRFSARLNILSLSNRESFRRQLDEMFDRPKGFWTHILNRACDLVRRAYSEQDPSIVLREAPDELTSGYILKPWAISDGPAFLFGMGDSGKTYFALVVVLIVALGAELFGWRAEPMNVLYVDYEATAHRLRRRLEALARGFGVEVPASIHYWPGRGIPLSEQVSALQTKIRAEKIGFMVIDSVGMAAGERAEKSDGAIPYMNTLGRLRVPSLNIAHVTKEEGDKYPFGSIFYHNSARLTWNVKRVQEEEDNIIHCGLFNRKSNDDRKAAPMGITFTFEVDDRGQPVKITLQREDVAEQFSSDLSLGRRIRAALRSRGKSTRELAEELDVKENQIRARLSQMKETLRLGTHTDGAALWGLSVRP